MKKMSAFRILVPILLANIIVIGIPFVFLQSGNALMKGSDPFQVTLQLSLILTLVLNISILIAFLIYQKMNKKLKPFTLLILTIVIFILECFFLFRNISDFEKSSSTNGFGLSSFTTSLLLFALFNASVVFIITKNRKRNSEEKK
jgi:uncharacterized membrane-anchored protein